MTGVEALLRWRLPDGRQVDPARFVPLAEDSGFIVALGRWVLEQACRQAAAWAAADPDLRLVLSVNLAARQVREPDVVEVVAGVLADTGWPAGQLQLELTESAIMTGASDGALARLDALAAMGVRIAVDDFGTGYSNLAYLRRLPVHAVKLAGSFVTGETGNRPAPGPRRGTPDPVDREVLALIVQLVHTLGLTATAESVETTEQCVELARMGCDTGQGWLFAPPLPAAAVPALAGRRLGEPEPGAGGRIAP
jgi:EAL domain-containing protein (putative c-di-GMP-specific phosphodiesterase class I)